MVASTPPADAVRRAGPDRWLIATLLACVVAFGVLLYLGRHLTFWWDEWDFIEIPGLGSVRDWFVPHNEHWSTLPFLLYKLTFGVVGLHSYIPYLVELLLVHLAAVLGVAFLVRRDLGPMAGFIAILPLLLLGAGYHNLFWAFQTGFVGSVATGVWALYALDTPGRRWTVAGAVLLVASLMCSGIGLIWVGAATVELALDPARRRRLVAVVPAIGAYLVWYLAFGSSGLRGEDAAAFSIRRLVEVPLFVARGIANAAGAFGGIGKVAGLLAVGGLALFALAQLARRVVPARTIAILLALVAMYGLIALVRVSFGVAYADRPRYVYVAAFLIVLGISSVLRQMAAAGGVPRALRVILVGAVAVSMVTGVIALRAGSTEMEAKAALTRAYVAAVMANEGKPWVDTRKDWSSFPTAGTIPDLVRRYGDPRRDTLFGSLLGIPEANASDALVLLLGHSFKAVPGVPPATPAPLRVNAANVADITERDGCLDATSNGSGSYVTLEVPGGASVTVTPTASGVATARIGRNGNQATRTRIDVPLNAGETTAVLVPDTGDGPWQVRVELPSDPVRLCVAPPT